ncbi:hypothetical protein EYF80_049294 [Liparis tanakae]|uniref:Uncharacterized protein n=1 Tax=Liparis tanakae TaxID=230148 RepID=A0A4Z2FHZ0_9TELE|nr:hypothetical protein EYF80_049294 [Liparis tanakae]
MTGVESRPHPDTAVAHDGGIRRALCVDVGLRVMNGTFHLSQNGSKKRLRQLELDPTAVSGPDLLLLLQYQPLET